MSITKPQLDAEYVRRCLDYDPDTGVFRWRVRDDVPNRWNGRYAGRVAGYINADGYRIVVLGNESWMAARLAWLWPTGDLERAVRSECRVSRLRDEGAE